MGLSAKERILDDSVVASSAHSVQRLLCVVVLLVVLLAVVYASWIGIVNFSRIRV
jgi:hypothetical protein